jgi:hypothetical protein
LPSHSKVLFVTKQFELWKQLTSYGVAGGKFSNGQPGRALVNYVESDLGHLVWPRIFGFGLVKD